MRAPAALRCSRAFCFKREVQGRLEGVPPYTHVSALRTRGRRPLPSPLEPEDTRLVAPAAGEPIEILHAREVIAAIHALPQAQREVVAAVDVAGFGYTEAAAQLRIPVGTVMSRLHRGRARLANYAAGA